MLVFYFFIVAIQLATHLNDKHRFFESIYSFTAELPILKSNLENTIDDAKITINIVAAARGLVKYEAEAYSYSINIS